MTGQQSTAIWSIDSAYHKSEGIGIEHEAHGRWVSDVVRVYTCALPDELWQVSAAMHEAEGWALICFFAYFIVISNMYKLNVNMWWWACTS